MTPEQSEALLKEFPPEQIGKLPRVTCKACVAANKQQWGSTCAKHRKIECEVCKNWISEKHIHLDFVGHAIATKRLLDVDPAWTWEPFALDATGLPAMRGNDLWIRLTIAGVTRPGVGDGPNAKEAIGDAIRNAAMRFGVALDLWTKEDLRASEENVAGSPEATETIGSANDGASTSGPVSPASSPAEQPPAPVPPASKNRVQQLQAKLSAMISEGVKGVAQARTERGLPKLTDDCTAEELDAWATLLNESDPNMTRELV